MCPDRWPRVQVFIDWDGTITKHDTMEEVARVGYKKNPETQPWSDIVRAYLDDYRFHRDSYAPLKDQRKTIKEESEWLESLSEVETRSVERVRDAGLFLGVNKNDMSEAAAEALDNGNIKLREGWKDLFLSELLPPEHSVAVVRRDGFRFHILSVNWSATFIKGCMLHASLASQSADDLKALIPMTYLANEMASCETSTSDTGNDSATIRTSADKVRTIEQVLHQHALGQNGNRKPITVYIGDSCTDFDALLYVDYGICIRDEPLGSGQRELVDTLKRTGVPVKAISELELSLPVQRAETKILWWAKDLREVSDFLLRILETVQNW